MLLATESLLASALGLFYAFDRARQGYENRERLHFTCCSRVARSFPDFAEMTQPLGNTESGARFRANEGRSHNF